MGYYIFFFAIVLLTWYVIKESFRKRSKLNEMSDNEVRRKYEDRIIKNEAQRRNNEIGKIYSTEFAEQDYLDDKFKNKSHEEIEHLNFMLPKDINTVGKLQGTQYNEQDRFDEELSVENYRKSLKEPNKKIDPVQQVLNEAYKEEQRGEQALGGYDTTDI